MDQCVSNERNKLRRKMSSVFGDNIQMLSVDLQEMLFDDLVTAFEDRVKVLKRAQLDVKIELVKSVDFETIKD